MNKITKSQRFFGRKENEIKDRFIFVEELSDIFINDGDEKKNLYLELSVYDSDESEFVQDKAILVLHEEIYYELFAFFLNNIEAVGKIRAEFNRFSKVENVVSDLKKITSKSKDYEQN